MVNRKNRIAKFCLITQGLHSNRIHNKMQTPPNQAHPTPVMVQTSVSPQQKILNDFQIQCMEMFQTNQPARDLIKDLVQTNHPINGVITMTQTTKSYLKYVRSHGVKMEKGKPVMTYMGFDQFLKTNQNMLNKQVLLVLQKYQRFTPEEKQTKFLFIFQVPYSHNPDQSLKNMAIIEIKLN